MDDCLAAVAAERGKQLLAKCQRYGADIEASIRKLLPQTAVGLDGGDQVRRGLLEVLHALVGENDADAHAAGQLQHLFEIAGDHPLELVDDEEHGVPPLGLRGGGSSM